MPTIGALAGRWRNDPKVRPAPPEKQSRTFGPHGLGLGIRIAILVECSAQHQADAAIAIFNAEKDDRANANSAVRKIEDACQPRASSSIQPETVERALEWFQREGFGPETCTLRDFREKHFLGDYAVHRFAAWLTGEEFGAEPRKDSSLMGASRNVEFHLDEARKELTTTIEGFLNPQAEISPRIVRVVHGEGLGEGLRAFARHIIDQVPDDDPREVLFLPVSRYPVGAGERGGGNISFATLVGHLDAFCANRPPEDATAFRDSRDLRDAIERIRARMVRAPMILVFDGWGGARGALSRLNALVLDDGLTELLSELVHPKIEPDARRRDPRLFYENRILVLSEGPLDELQAFQQKPEQLTVPPTGKMMTIIRAQKRRNRRLLASLCDQTSLRRDALMTMLDDLLTFESRKPGFDLESKRADWGQPKLVTRAWTDHLSAEQPRVLLILRFIALSRDGLRLDTLLRLLDQWKTMVEGDTTVPAPWNVTDMPRDMKSLELVLQGLIDRRLVIVGSDEKIRGLDEPALARREAWGDAPPDPKGPRFVDVPSNLLRRELLEDLFTRGAQGTAEAQRRARRQVARMHRLIAEAALAQHTALARHATDTSDARYFRRLIQAVFHGFASLIEGPRQPDGKPLLDAALKRIPHTIPADPQHAYERLYAVFYRGLIEAPPDWELSRVIGREDLKIDVMLAAMNADQTTGGAWKQLYGFQSGLTARPTGFLDDSEVGKRVKLDQYTGLARAAYHRADYDRAAEAVGLSLSLLGDPPENPADDSFFTERTSAFKAKADILIAIAGTRDGALDEDLSKASDEITTALQALDFPDGGVETIMRTSDQRRTVETSDNVWAPDEDLTQLVTKWSKGKDAERLAAWSDLLGRLGEATALQIPDDVAESHATSTLLRSFVILFAAERLRRLAFRAAPLKRAFYVNGHATRVQVRTMLQLVQAHDQLSDQPVPRGMPSRPYLIAQSRRHIDMLTRYLSRLPTELASLHILESAFARREKIATEVDLEMAHLHLASADTMLAATIHRPRVRLRYTVERCKVYIASFERAKEEGDRRGQRRLAYAAILEAVRLECMADEIKGDWGREARKQSARAEAIYLDLIDRIGEEDPDDLSEILRGRSAATGEDDGIGISAPAGTP